MNISITCCITCYTRHNLETIRRTSTDALELAAEHRNPITKTNVYAMTNAEMVTEIVQRGGTANDNSTKAELAKLLVRHRRREWKKNGSPAGPGPIVSVEEAAQRALRSEFVSLRSHFDVGTVDEVSAGDEMEEDTPGPAVDGGGAGGGAPDTDGSPMDVPGDGAPAGDIFAKVAADFGFTEPKYS